MYNITAHPTLYNGVQFRSRLESRWAAFFDLCKWRWDYEPIDLQGWTPDFLIHAPQCKVFVEIKPTDIDQYRTDAGFGKAKAHWQKCQVLLLGMQPQEHSYALGIGKLLDTPEDANYDWEDLHGMFRLHCDDLWREAGNVVQWQP